MNLLVDTQLLIWLTSHLENLSKEARTLLEDNTNKIVFSVASVWEISIKSGLKGKDLPIDPASLRNILLVNKCIELPISAEHAIGVRNLPTIHKDPFDRLLVAQAIAEDMLLLTTDRKIADYDGPIRLV